MNTKRMWRGTLLAWLALAGCSGDVPPEMQAVAVPDPSADPPRTRGAPFRPRQRIDVGAADAVTDYYANNFPHEVALPGDLDGDRIDDLLVFGVSSSPPETVECSQGCPAFDRAFVDVVYGAPGLGRTSSLRASARIATWHVRSLRHRVRAAGDVDGDGRADFLLGVWTHGCEQGNAFVVYGGARLAGSSDVRERGAMLRERGNCSHFGLVSGVGDVDGDGFDDFVVGASAAQEGAGRLFLYYGGRARPAARRSEADAAAVLVDRGGRSFAEADPVGDVNGDGADDFIAYGRERENGPPHRPWLVFGSTTRLAGEVDVASSAARIDARMLSATRLGDVDRDGVDDFAMTAATSQERDAFLFRGRAQWGAAVTLDAATTRVRRDAPSQDATFIIGAGDVDGDGTPDLLYGDPGYGLPSVARGAAYLFFGGRTGFAPELTLPEATAFLGQAWAHGDGRALGPPANLGRAVAGGGDVNGDGRDDIVFTASGAPDSGRVYLWLGRARP